MNELQIEQQMLERELDVLHDMLELQRDICDSISVKIEERRALIQANMKKQMEVANVK
jgi:hypothetical protein